MFISHDYTLSPDAVSTMFDLDQHEFALYEQIRNEMPEGTRPEIIADLVLAHVILEEKGDFYGATYR